MEREKVRPGLRVQITHKTKYGGHRWLAPAQVLSVVDPDAGNPNIRIMLLDGAADIFHSVDPADLDFE